MDESRLVRRLKEMYSEVEVDTDAPNPKRVKFSNVQDELQKSFPSGAMSTFAVSRAITSAFPNSLSKNAGKHAKSTSMELNRGSFQLSAHLLNCCLHHTSLHHMNLRLHQMGLQLCWHTRRPKISTCSKKYNILKREFLSLRKQAAWYNRWTPSSSVVNTSPRVPTRQSVSIASPWRKCLVRSKRTLLM